MRLHTLCGPRGLGATSHGDCSFVVAALRSRDGIDVNLVQTTPLPESSLARILLSSSFISFFGILRYGSSSSSPKSLEKETSG